MSGNINKVILIGNIGKDPEIRTMQDGKEVANLVLATNESWTDKNSGERKEKTEWHRIACFNPGLVGVIKSYIKKGAKIYIEGQLQTRKWQDKDGQDKYSTEIVLQGYNCNLTMLSGKQEESNQSTDHLTPIEPKYPEGKTGFANDGLNDDIPF